MAEQTMQPEAPLKPHGDKLSAAAGSENPASRPAEAPEIEPSEGSLKAHGDKLQAPVDAALGKKRPS